MELYEDYGDEVQFFLVYIREAHPIDGSWPTDFKGIEDPITDAERLKVAGSCVADLGLEEIPALVDRMDDAVSRAYAAFPDRLYLVGRDGRIAYAGGPGPFGFKPEELEKAIESELAGKRGRGRDL